MKEPVLIILRGQLKESSYMNMIIIDSESNKPLYVQIYEQIKEQIIMEEIPKGSKLPSIRSLSAMLNVSRNTVETAYLQLSSEGFIESRPGSGYISVNLDNMDLLRPASVISAPKRHEDSEEEIEKKKFKYNFHNRALSSHNFPVRTWKKLINQCLSNANIENFHSYNSQRGERDLQIELVKYLNRTRGINCDPDQIIISSGMEYALGLLCQLFREEHGQVAIEDPGYMVARRIFENNGYKPIPISLDRGGINLDELRGTSVRLVYVTPSHQFPMGIVMPIKKRIELLEWAIKNKAIIIEDDYDSEFRYNSKPIPALQSIDSKESVVYIGTFSKSLSPGLRLNYMVLPRPLLDRYDKLFSLYRVPVSYIEQKVLKEFMHQGYWDRYLRKMITTAMKRHEFLIKTIEEYMGDSVIIHGKNGGLHIVLEFNNGLKEDDLVNRARGKDILISPVSMFWMRKERYSNNMVLLGYGGMDEEEIVEGIKLLKSALVDGQDQ